MLGPGPRVRRVIASLDVIGTNRLCAYLQRRRSCDTSTRKAAPHLLASLSNILVSNAKVQVGPQSHEAMARACSAISLLQELHKVQRLLVSVGRQCPQFLVNSLLA